MIGPGHDLFADRLDGPRWELDLELLFSGRGAVSFRGVALRTDPATATIGRRLHVEFDCPFDPSQVGKAQHDRLAAVAQRELEQARSTIEAACLEDERFAALVADTGVVYEFVHRYGMAGLLVATAGRSGNLAWR